MHIKFRKKCKHYFLKKVSRNGKWEMEIRGKIKISYTYMLVANLVFEIYFLDGSFFSP